MQKRRSLEVVGQPTIGVAELSSRAAKALLRIAELLTIQAEVPYRWPTQRASLS